MIDVKTHQKLINSESRISLHVIKLLQNQQSRVRVHRDKSFLFELRSNKGGSLRSLCNTFFIKLDLDKVTHPIRYYYSACGILVCTSSFFFLKINKVETEITEEEFKIPLCGLCGLCG